MPRRSQAPRLLYHSSRKLATKRSWRDKQTGERVSRTECHRAIAWGKPGDFARTLAKGSHVQLDGELRSHSYTGKDNVWCRVSEVHLGSIRNLDRAERPSSRSYKTKGIGNNLRRVLILPISKPHSPEQASRHVRTAWTIKDADVRVALKRALSSEHAGDQNTVVIEEMGVRHGAARVDLAVVNGVLHGYEVKSDRDTLERLPEQIQAYNSVFDFVTLVVGERHLKSALDLIPEWWGIKTARMESGKIFFCDLKLPLSNPAPDAAAVVRLLWRREAIAVAHQLFLPEFRPAQTRNHIYSQLVQHADPNWLRDRVRDCLKTRSDWRLGEQQLSGGD